MNTLKQIAFLFLTTAISITALGSNIIYVENGDNLDAKVELAKLGDTVIIKPGTYGIINLNDKIFTESQPLVIKSDGSGTVLLKSTSISENTFKLSSCSYIVLDGVKIEGGLRGILIEGSDHVIIKDNEICHNGQEGIHVNKSSSYIDIIGNYIHETGRDNPQWGEGIYVGTGSSVPFPDNSEHVWIEGNTIKECGNGEGINIKSECFHVTIKGNTVSEIAPGTDSQYNQSAITIEGAQNSLNNNYRVDEPRDIWIDHNEIYNVSGGYSNWDNGIMISGIGVNVINNKIHHCDDNGIYANDYATLDLPCAIFANEIFNTNNDIKIPSKFKNISTDVDPGTNPNLPQSWYGSYSFSAKYVDVVKSNLILNKSQTTQLNAAIAPFAAGDVPINWSSSDNNIVSIDDLGNITGIAKGKCIVTAQSEDGALKDSLELEVIIIPNELTLNIESVTIKSGDSIQLQATVLPEDANDKSILWSSSNKRVATVDTNGVVHAIEPGTTTIKARTKSGSIRASCEITVDNSVGINTITKDSFFLYPNPLNEEDLKISLPGTFCEIEIVDLNGQLIHQVSSSKTVEKINRHLLNSGIFIISMQIENSFFVRKLVVM